MRCAIFHWDLDCAIKSHRRRESPKQNHGGQGHTLLDEGCEEDPLCRLDEGKITFYGALQWMSSLGGSNPSLAKPLIHSSLTSEGSQFDISSASPSGRLLSCP